MSDLWERKIRRYFRVFDVNSDGVITVEYFEVLAQRFTEDLDDKRRYEIARETLYKLFFAFDAAADGNGRITEDRFVDGCRKLRCSLNFLAVIKEVAKVCFALLDSDGDGLMEEADFARLFYNQRIPDHERLAKISFKELDTNRDGKLNFEEASTGYYDYLLSDDESLPSKTFFGPLV